MRRTQIASITPFLPSFLPSEKVPRVVPFHPGLSRQADRRTVRQSEGGRERETECRGVAPTSEGREVGKSLFLISLHLAATESLLPVANADNNGRARASSCGCHRQDGWMGVHYRCTLNEDDTSQVLTLLPLALPRSSSALSFPLSLPPESRCNHLGGGIHFRRYSLPPFLPSFPKSFSESNHTASIGQGSRPTDRPSERESEGVQARSLLAGE